MPSTSVQTTTSKPSEARKGAVLVADDDPNVRRFLEMNLLFEGYDVALAADGESAYQVAIRRRPDLILLDVMLPVRDGIEVCRLLRGHPHTASVPIILVTGRTLMGDKLEGLAAGADDYVSKPFDPIELLARVRTSIYRTRMMRSASPLTNLPGNASLQEELERVIREQRPFAVLYMDLDHFKAYNDHYGFSRGDEVLKLAAACLQDAVTRYSAGSFIGHVGGDDFVAIVPPGFAEGIAAEAISLWDRSIPTMYDAADLGRGHIEVTDRQDRVHRFPVMTVSVGIVSSLQRELNNPGRASEIATEMKAVSKRDPHSSYAIDRRTD